MDIDISRINDYIIKNLKQEFTLRDISDYFGYSQYHFAREYKARTGRSIMDYVRECKVFAAAGEIADGNAILETALVYGFDTHAGFTRAFTEIIGCTPQEYHRHYMKLRKMGEKNMDISKVKIRLICKDDVNDLWENVYSAMTPRQIIEDKIIPSIENYKNQKGFMAAAEVDGAVVMTMWVERLWSSPGFIYDSHYAWQNSEYDTIFTKLLDGVIKFAKQLHFNVLCLYEEENSPYIEGFVRHGFKKIFAAGGLEYYMLEI